MTQDASSHGALLEALGALVVSFSSLEESFHDAFVMLARDSNMVTINVLTAGLSFRTLVEKFGALCREEARSLRVPLAEAQGYCNYVLGLNEKRNRYVHSAWGLDDRDTGPRRIKRSTSRKWGFQLDIRDVSPAEIYDLVERLQQAEDKLWEIVPW